MINYYSALGKLNSNIIAVRVVKEAVEKGFDMQLGKVERSLLYMPLMHSEDLDVHDELAVPKLGEVGSAKYEEMHRNIIARFGRYPHRNRILNRESTAEEVEFLKEPNSSF